MERLSRESSKHLTPPYGEVGDGIYDYPRQMWRTIRKRFGWPASGDVSTLCSVIDALRCRLLADMPPDQTISQVVVSYPPVLALYEEDIRDALEYLRLPSWTGEPVIQYRTPTELLSTFKGHGFNDLWRPDGQGISVLLVEYTQRALSVEFDSVIFTGSRMPGVMNANFSAGSLQSNQPSHWTNVERDVMRALTTLHHNIKPEIDYVFLVGEDGGDEELRKRISLLVADYGNPEIISKDALYVAAKGAAAIAWSYLEEKSKAQEDKGPYRF